MEEERENGDNEVYEEPPHYQIELWVRGASSPETFSDIKQAAKKSKDAIQMQFYSLNGGQLPAEISRFKSLESLYLDFPDGAVLPPQLWKLTQLKSLMISSWKGIAISPQIAKLTNLKRLDIRGSNEYDSFLPEEIGSLKSLESLWIIDHKEIHMPRHYDLPNLKSVYLENLRMNEFPSGLEKSPLDSLTISLCPIEVIPSAIGQIRTLTYLDLRANGVKILPDEIGELTQLRELRLVNGLIERLPESIGNLHELRNLEISWLNIDYLPNSICQLEKLEVLDAFGSPLKALPPCIGELQALKRLILDGGEIEFLPASIGDLHHLEYLNLNHNQLQTLPGSISGLTRLSVLATNQNPLKTLPREILYLPELRDFECDRSGLLESEEEIWAFLNRNGHRIPVVPMEIAGKPLSYYLARQDIDLGAKMYVQGNLKLNTDALSVSILDSVMTDNPETMPFYAHVFMSCIRPKEAGGFSRFSYLPYQEQIKDLSGAFVRKHPCWFLEHVVTGQYSDRYSNWVESGKFEFPGEYLSVEELMDAMLEIMQKDCPDFETGVWDQLGADLENRW